MKRERRIAVFLLFLSIIAGVMMVRTFSKPPITPVLPDKSIQNKDGFALENDFEPLADTANQLFANPKNGAESETAVAEKAPWESHLYHLVLKGTAGSALAVVQPIDGSAEIIVRRGDTVGQARVVHIERNLLELDGAFGRDILRLPQGDRDTSHPGSIDLKSPFQTGATDSGLLVIDRQKLLNLTTRVDALSNDITLQPVRDADGAPAGFRVDFLNSDGVFEQMGLCVGDIVISVNGQTILTVEDAYRVLASAPHQNTLSLSILRARQPMEIDYVIR